MTGTHDIANPPPAAQAALELNGPTLEDQIARLQKELEAERSYRKQMEKDLQKFRRAHWRYAAIDEIYRRIRTDAENDAQDPFDEHFRECLYGLQAIGSDPDARTCQSHGWHGEGHDSQCPIRIAEEACARADTALGKGLKARHPHYQSGKGGAA